MVNKDKSNTKCTIWGVNFQTSYSVQAISVRGSTSQSQDRLLGSCFTSRFARWTDIFEGRWTFCPLETRRTFRFRRRIYRSVLPPKPAVKNQFDQLINKMSRRGNFKRVALFLWQVPVKSCLYLQKHKIVRRKKYNIITFKKYLNNWTFRLTIPGTSHHLQQLQRDGIYPTLNGAALLS